MQIAKGIRIIGAAILALGVAAYIVYAMMVSAGRNDTDKCTGIKLNIEKNSHSGFITYDIVEKDLRDANILPTGRPMCDISTGQIERTLGKNEFVEQIECYKTSNNKVAIDITERTPVIYLLPDNGEGYYVDRHGKVITKNSYPVNLPVATGSFTRQYAGKHLSRLGEYLLNNPFWNNQIEQIHVSVNSDREYVIDLVPRVGDHIIHLGTLDKFQDKLRRLMVFYRQAITKVGWTKYSVIDLEYEGQIICKKQKD